MLFEVFVVLCLNEGCFVLKIVFHGGNSLQFGIGPLLFDIL